MTINVNPVSVTVKVGTAAVTASTGTPVVKEYLDRPAYEGAYEVTPSSEMQVLETKHKRMTDNIIINPIPSNYGLITWNGATLTVS